MYKSQLNFVKRRQIYYIRIGIEFIYVRGKIREKRKENLKIIKN